MILAKSWKTQLHTGQYELSSFMAIIDIRNRHFAVRWAANPRSLDVAITIWTDMAAKSAGSLRAKRSVVLVSSSLHRFHGGTQTYKFDGQ